MILSIASGKGGTGKTTLAVNLALSLESAQLLDCDVEEPNVHLLLHPNINEEKPVYVPIPEVDENLCDHCGRCADFCEYNAIFVGPEKVVFFPELCHSCGGCLIVCPKKAIVEKQRKIGTTKKGTAKDLELVYGELDVGEPMAVPLIKEVKKYINDERVVIIDSPPGTACPVIEAVYGSDYCLLATEPTPFGLHDLKITIQVLEQLKIPFGVVVNRAGIGDKKVYEYCKEKDIPIMLEIPFQRKIAELYSKGIPFVEKMPAWKRNFQMLLENVKGRIES